MLSTFLWSLKKYMNFFLVTELDEKNHKMTTVVLFIFHLTIGCWFCFTIYLVGDMQHSSSLKCKSKIKAKFKLSWEEFTQVFGSRSPDRICSPCVF